MVARDVLVTVIVVSGEAVAVGGVPEAVGEGVSVIVGVNCVGVYGVRLAVGVGET